MCAIAWQQALPLVQVETDSASKQHSGIARLQRFSDGREVRPIEDATFASISVSGGTC